MPQQRPAPAAPPPPAALDQGGIRYAFTFAASLAGQRGTLSVSAPTFDELRREMRRLLEEEQRDARNYAPNDV